MKKIFLILMLICGQWSFSQTKITGTVVDDDTKEALSFAIATLYDHYSNKMLGYKQANKEGKFTFPKKYEEGIYRIEVLKSGYIKTTKQLVIATAENKELNIEIPLKAEAEVLEEMVINVEKPIIVKQDTIIYDIKKLSDKHDANLEETLAKLPGFEIKGDGSILVNGKLIRKVLVDGREVSGFGSQVLTKSIGSQMVDKVEVRFNEKNKKIKESLFEEDYAVLDVKLKEEMKKLLIGKVQPEVGYQDELKFGGNVNLFSLSGSVVDVQFFAENSNLKQNTISIFNVRNIGTEAIFGMFGPTSNIEELKKRPLYQSNLYGFDGFVQRDNTVAGLSVSYPINPKSSLMLVSFSDYKYLKNHFLKNTYYQKDIFSNFLQENKIRGYNTKNRLLYDYTTDNYKQNTYIDFAYSDVLELKNINDKQLVSDFSHKSYSKEWIAKNKMEYDFESEIGLSAQQTFMVQNNNTKAQLSSLDTEINNYFGLTNNDYFWQNTWGTQKMFTNEVSLFFDGKKYGQHTLEYKYLYNSLEDEKSSIVSDFQSPNQRYYITANTLSYNYYKKWMRWLFKTDLGYTFTGVPSLENNKQNYKGYLHNNVYLHYQFNAKSTIVFDWRNKLSMLPMRKLTSGKVLEDFQLFSMPYANILPYRENAFDLFMHYYFKNNSNIYLSVARGEYQNINSQTVDRRFIVNQYNQLSSIHYNYYANYTMPIYRNDVWWRNRVQWSNVQYQYLNQNKVEANVSDTYQAASSIIYEPNKQWKTTYVAEYTNISIKNSKKPFHFLSNSIDLVSKMLNNDLQGKIRYRQVNFLHNKQYFHNFDISFSYVKQGYKVLLDISNIFDSKRFVTRDLTGSITSEQINRVFGRYINIGVQFNL